MSLLVLQNIAGDKVTKIREQVCKQQSVLPADVVVRIDFLDYGII